MTFLEFLKLCLLGIIQGFTEPLPISSSAHMLFVDHYFNIGVTNLYFEAIINFSSTLAIAFFFRKKIFLLIKNTFSKKVSTSYLNRKYFILLIIASIPVVIVGFLFNDWIETYLTNYKFAGICLLLTSIILFGIFLMLHKKQIFCDNVSFFDGIMIGLMQAIALIPGISRSGSTMFAGVSRNVDLKKTLEFSFFLNLIASLGAFVLTCFKIEWSKIDLLTYLVPFILSFITTYFSIKLFYEKINDLMLLGFSAYTLIVSLFVLIF